MAETNDGDTWPPRVRDPLADYRLSDDEIAAAKIRAGNQAVAAPTRPASAAEALQREIDDARARAALAPPPTVQAPQPSNVWPPSPYAQPPPMDMFAELALEKYKPAGGAAVAASVFQVINIGVRIWIFAGYVSGAAWVVSPALIIAQLAAPILAWAAMINFIQLSYSNAAVFGTGRLSTTSNAAIWQCIIPGLSFYRPLVIMQEVWKTSDPAVRSDPMRPHLAQGGMSSMLINGWWVAYIIGLLAARLIPAADVAMIGLRCLLLVVPSILAIMVVNSVTERQEAKILTFIEPVR